jgi:cytochrome-b5 reductase
MAEKELKEISKAELAKHNTKEDLWFIIHNKVYDVTKYQTEHPGGIEVLMQLAADDASEMFEATGHSDEARKKLDKLIVGQLPSEDREDDVEVFHKVYPDTHNPDLKPLGKESYALFLGLTGMVAYCTSKVSSRYHLGQRFRHLLSQPFNQGVLIAFVVSGGIGGYVLFKSIKYLIPQSHPKGGPTYRPDDQPHVARKTHAVPKRSRDVCPLSKTESKKLLLQDKQQLSHDTWQFTFALPRTDRTLAIPVGAHVVIEAEIKGEKVTRSYTPASSPTTVGTFDLAVKVYPDGKMGTWLRSLTPGKDSVALRGPKGSMDYHRGWAKSILMIAGGSGITPMFQLLLSICEDEKDETKIVLLFANKTEEDILLKDQLNALADKNKQLEIIHVLSDADESWEGPKGFITKDIIKPHVFDSSDKDNRVLLCGPPPMVDAIKKATVELGYDAAKHMSTMKDQTFVF